MSATEKITLGGGCFWCIEAVYRRTDGVVGCTSGYAGGTKPNPTYEEVCTGGTGHAEVVQVEFDPARLPLERVLDVFFKAHDPTTPNRQGDDVGTQYRSVIYYHDERQRPAAEAATREAAKRHARPATTEIKRLDTFHPAEEYHQRYFERNPGKGYCRLVIAPKLGKLGVPTTPLQ